MTGKILEYIITAKDKTAAALQSAQRAITGAEKTEQTAVQKTEKTRDEADRAAVAGEKEKQTAIEETTQAVKEGSREIEAAGKTAKTTADKIGNLGKAIRKGLSFGGIAGAIGMAYAQLKAAIVDTISLLHEKQEAVFGTQLDNAKNNLSGLADAYAAITKEMEAQHAQAEATAASEKQRLTIARQIEDARSIANEANEIEAAGGDEARIKSIRERYAATRNKSAGDRSIEDAQKAIEDLERSLAQEEEVIAARETQLAELKNAFADASEKQQQQTALAAKYEAQSNNKLLKAFGINTPYSGFAKTATARAAGYGEQARGAFSQIQTLSEAQDASRARVAVLRDQLTNAQSAKEAAVATANASDRALEVNTESVKAVAQAQKEADAKKQAELKAAQEVDRAKKQEEKERYEQALQNVKNLKAAMAQAQKEANAGWGDAARGMTARAWGENALAQADQQEADDKDNRKYARRMNNLRAKAAKGVKLSKRDRTLLEADNQWQQAQANKDPAALAEEQLKTQQEQLSKLEEIAEGLRPRS